MEIESLPTELLMRVLSFLDVETLLRAVPLVCRAWRSVALDPAVWSGVDAVYSEFDKAAQQAVKVAVRRAPCLRTLDLSDNYAGTEDDAGLLLALLAGTAQVHRFEGVAERDVDKSHVLKLLPKYGPHLRSLKLTLGPAYGDYRTKLHGRLLNVFTEVARMPCLRRLELEDETLKLELYSGQLGAAGSCPCLERVAFLGFPEQAWIGGDDHPLILDVLRNRRDALRALDLVWTNHDEELMDMFPDTPACTCCPNGHLRQTGVRALPPSMLRAVNDCHRLEALRVMFHSVAAIRNLEHLRALWIVVSTRRTKAGKLNALERFMRECDTMRHLTHVTIQYIGYDDKVEARLRARFEPVIRDVCPSLRKFEVDEFESRRSVV